MGSCIGKLHNEERARVMLQAAQNLEEESVIHHWQHKPGTALQENKNKNT